MQLTHQYHHLQCTMYNVDTVSIALDSSSSLRSFTIKLIL